MQSGKENKSILRPFTSRKENKRTRTVHETGRKINVLRMFKKQKGIQKHRIEVT